jgi:ribosomal protein L22
MSTDEPEKTEDVEETAEETEAVAADAAAAGADAPEADAPEVEADAPEVEPAEAEADEAPKPRRRRRKAAEPVAEEPAEAPEAVEAEPEAETEADEEPEAAPAKPTRAAPARRRARRDPSLPAPVVRAQAKYVRSSARKARLVCDHIRGKSVEEARAILALTPRAIARDWSKLLESAVANAEHNHELVGEDLYVKAVQADEGPTIKRFRPRAMGRATRIRKRTSHLTILLTPKD